jgi:2-polyprenylphenol 6-hydroxylase
MKMHSEKNYDIVIIGCGLVGGSLALTLPDALSIAVIDAESPMQQQPGYLALNIHSCNILKAFGIWDKIATHTTSAVTPIKHMDVSELPHATGQVLLRSEDIGAPALGYVTSTVAIRETLLAHIQSKKNITLYCPEKAEAIQWPDEGMEKIVVQLSNKSSGTLHLSARLAIMADGGRSPLRHQLGFVIDEKKTGLLVNHHIVISRVKTSKPHKNLAFERFTQQGPIALLPLNQAEYILVWTMHHDKLVDFLAQDDKTLIKALAIAYNKPEINDWQEEKQYRKSYPITCSLVKDPIKTRLVLMGNAAHSVHPVGAQGFNLSLKDALNLSHFIHEAIQNQQDIGSERLLKKYMTSRKDDTDFVVYFTQSLLGLFSNKALSSFRRMTMSWMNHLPSIKQTLLKRATGTAQPRLAISCVDDYASRKMLKKQPLQPYDIIILGNRLIGSTLACALDSRYRIAILDKASTPELPTDQNYQLRINAYNRSSQALLEKIGVWNNIPSDRRFVFDKVFATSEQSDNLSELFFDAKSIHESHIGHFIENDLVTFYLHQKLKTLPNVDFFDNTSVIAIQPESDFIHITTASNKTNKTVFSGKLLAACDGAFSTARNLLGIDVSRHLYDQRCIVANIFFDGDLDKTAWQRFLKTGPLGLLPLRKGVCSLAWSCDNDRTEQLLALPDTDFIAELEQATQGRLGKILRLSPRQSFPLVAQHATQYTAPRTLLLGDAAHTIHPLGGLGANLGFQDVIAATALLNDPKISSRDIGRRYLLEKYEKMRRRHNSLVMSSMTAFNALFHQDCTALNPLGRLSLRLTNKITPIKNALFRQAMWMSDKPL